MRISAPAIRKIQTPTQGNAVAAAAAVRNNRLLDYSRELMKEYGAHTVLNRALTDFRDGLKPVHRRVMWAMYESGYYYSKGYVKSARPVADTMGKYHPHGDGAIYDSMETNVRKIPFPLIDGEGNWGNITGDPKAAMRYTEARLTRYAQTVLLDPKYLAVVPMVDNYDAKEKEPLYLPALLPNLLLNGAEGIAVGVRTGIPPVHPDSIIRVAVDYLKTRTPVNEKSFIEDIAFNFAVPCDCLSSMDDVEGWLRDGVGSLKFGPIYDWNANTRTLMITGVPMPFNWANIVEKLLTPPTKDAKGKVRGFDFTRYVALADEATDKNSVTKEFEIRFKAAVDEKQREVVDRVLALFNQSFSTYSSFTIRNSEDDIQFAFAPLPNLLMRWCSYRVDLEKRYQKHRYQELATEFQKQRLMMFARRHIDVIIRIVKTSRDPKAELCATLKINPEQAAAILDLALRQLTKISITAIQEKMKALKAESDEAKRIFANPVPTLVNHLVGPMSTLLQG